MSKFDVRYNEILGEIAPVVAALARPVAGAVLGTAAKNLANTKEENVTNPAQQVQPQAQQPVNTQQTLKDLSSQLAKVNNPTEIEKMLSTPETQKALAAILTAK
jgi:hypothetical protein